MSADAAASRAQFITSKYMYCMCDGVTFLIISTACICSLLFSFTCAGGLSSHNKLRVAGNTDSWRLWFALFSAAGRQYLPARAALFDPHKFNNYFAGMRANTRPIFEHKYSSNCVFRACEFPLSKSINTQKQNWANQNKLRLPQSAQREQYETGNVCWINK